MKWKNIDTGESYYNITDTFVEWLSILQNADARMIVCEEIKRVLDKCGGVVSAFVLMPDHCICWFICKVMKCSIGFAVIGVKLLPAGLMT